MFTTGPFAPLTWEAAADAFEQALGTRPLLTRVGGSIPLMPALTEKGIDTILSGFALPESNIHSPNERFLVPYFAAGIDTVAALFTQPPRKQEQRGHSQGAEE